MSTFRSACLLASLLLAFPAWAWDDRYQITVEGTLSTDDNLGRSGAGTLAASDILATQRLAASATLPDGARN